MCLILVWDDTQGFGIGMSVDYRHHFDAQKGSVEMISTHPPVLIARQDVVDVSSKHVFCEKMTNLGANSVFCTSSTSTCFWFLSREAERQRKVTKTLRL